LKRRILFFAGLIIFFSITSVSARDFLTEIETHYGAGKVDDALAVAKAFAEAHADSVAAHGFLGTLYAETGQLDAAATAFRKLISIKPGSVRGYRDLAVVHARQGKFDLALSTLGEGVTKSDEPALLLAERGSLQGDLGRGAAAIADFEAALQRRPDFIEVYQTLALTHIALGDTSSAVGIMDRGLVANSGNVMLMVNRGGIFHALGMTQKALGAYREAIAASPDDPSALRALGFMAAEVDSFDIAQQAWEKVRDLAADDLEVRDALAQLYAARGNLDESIGEMQAVLERAPDGNPVRFRLAEVYAAQGNLSGAKAELLTCIDRASNWMVPYKRLALLYLGEDNVDSAGIIYEKALTIDPKDAEIHNNLGFIYSAQGDLDKARAAYEVAMAESQDANTLRDAQGNLDIIKSIQAGKMRVRHILVKTEIEAQEILTKLKAGEDFATLARSFSVDPSKENGGSTGFFTKGDLHRDFEAAVMKLKPNEVSGVVKTPLGYHLIMRIN
jgi:parvulin-like peptidyl-prolyl isomerase